MSIIRGLFRYFYVFWEQCLSTRSIQNETFKNDRRWSRLWQRAGYAIDTSETFKVWTNKPGPADKSLTSLRFSARQKSCIQIVSLPKSHIQRHFKRVFARDSRKYIVHELRDSAPSSFSPGASWYKDPLYRKKPRLYKDNVGVVAKSSSNSVMTFAEAQSYQTTTLRKSRRKAPDRRKDDSGRNGHYVITDLTESWLW